MWRRDRCHGIDQRLLDSDFRASRCPRIYSVSCQRARCQARAGAQDRCQRCAMAAAAPFIRVAAGQLSAQRADCRAASLRASARASAGVRGLTHPTYAEGLDGDESSAAPRRRRHHRRDRPAYHTRGPEALACLRHYSCHSSAETIAKALTGSYRAEHLFALEQELALYDAYHEKASACDVRIEAVLKELSIHRGHGHGSAPRASRRRNRTDQANALAFDVRGALFALLGKNITTIDGLGPYLSLKLIAECGDDLSSWPSAKHFTSWLGLAPSNKVSGGKMLSSRTRRSGGRAAALLRLAAVTVGRTDTALGAFYRPLSSRIGKAKAVTATARKVAVLFYNAVRHGMEYVDPGASSYQTRYRTRVVNNLHRRAKAFGFVLQPLEPKAGAVVS